MGYNELYYYWVKIILIIIYPTGGSQMGEINTIITGSLPFNNNYLFYGGE
jgi:hypothetical protein